MATVTSHSQRGREICKAVGDAMKALGDDYDFQKVSPEISKAGFELDEAMADYTVGTASKRQVQEKYKLWRDLHRTGGLF